MGRQITGGVYMIISVIKPFRAYIGSSKDLYGRKQHHFNDLRRGQHISHKLQRHHNKYGRSDLIFVVLEVLTDTSKDNLLKREQFYLDLLHPYFNNTPTAGSLGGMKQTPESTQKKISKTKGVKRGKMTEEHKVNWYTSRHGDGKGNCLRGTHKSEETKKKISITLTGRKPPPKTQETRDKLSKALTGRKLSPEHILKIKKNMIGRVPWNKGLTMDTDPRVRDNILKSRKTIADRKVH